MTGVRALVRRGLTSRIHCEPIRSGLEGKYLMDLIFQMRGDGLPREHYTYHTYSLPNPGGPNPPRGGTAVSVSTTATSHLCAVKERRLTIALASAQLNGPEDTEPRHDYRHRAEAGLLDCLDFDLDTRIPLRLAVYNTIDMLPDQGFVTNTLRDFEDYTGICGVYHREEFEVSALCTAIEEMAKFFHTTKFVKLKAQNSMKNQNSDIQVDGFFWGFDIITGALDSTENRFHVALRVLPEPSQNRWVLDHDSRKTISGLVGWSARTLQSKMMDSATTPNDKAQRATGEFLGLYVVGHGDVDCELLRKWMGYLPDMKSTTHGDLRLLEDDTPQRWKTPLFGLFLSSISEIQ